MKAKYDWESKPVKCSRDKVIKQLELNYAKSNLDSDEFEERLNIAHKTKDKEELFALIKDLPELEWESPNSHKEVSNITNIFFGSIKNKKWIPSERLGVTSIFGGSHIDFRQADFENKNVKVELTNIFGMTNIIVPPGINVILKGVNIMGGMVGSSTEEFIPDAPTVEICGTSIFGGAKISVKPIEN